MAEVHSHASIGKIEKISRSEDEDQLQAWKAEATLKYSVHDYDGAAELYSQATELQARLNGEMSSMNADLLYQYGRCLYHVAVRKSDVLGSKVAGEKIEEGSSESSKTQQPRKQKLIEKEVQDAGITHEAITTAVDGAHTSDQNKENSRKDNKPFFQFTGDENFEDSDDEEGTGGMIGDEATEDEEDDFANAYEVLDLARILLLKRLEEAQDTEIIAQDLKSLKERLADTYDLQAEILLEGERFSLAVNDLKAALELKQALFPRESSLIAEAHYKLSLALEFSSMTQQKDSSHANDENGAKPLIDQGMREAAAKEMEAAIESCKLRLKEEEAKLQSASSHDDENFNSGEARRKIQEVKEIVDDMQQRLIELHQPPFSISDRTGMGTAQGLSSMNGILGSILSESPAIQREKLEAASIGAADLTNLIKRRAATNFDESDQASTANTLRSNGKRKVGFVEEAVEVDVGKRAKLSGTDDK